MAEILDCILAIVRIWFYLMAILAIMSTALFVAGLLMYRPSKNQPGHGRMIAAAQPEARDEHRRSKLTADLL